MRSVKQTDSDFSRRALFSHAAKALAAGAAGTGLAQWAGATASATPSVIVPHDEGDMARPVFYVSASGSDSASGSRPDLAWTSIDKVNSSVPSGGSTVLFKRGDTFYGELAPPYGCAIAAYGDGPKPVLTMYKLLNRADGWIEHSPGLWTIDLGKRATHDGYVGSSDANIGYLLVDGVVMPARKSLLFELASPWDFWCNIKTNTLYVKVPSNPTEIAADIKAAPNGTAFGETGRVVYFGEGSNEIRDMHITGTGGCGIGGAAPDVYVHDCLINLVGGAVLQDGTNRRYGNGIENWVNVKRWVIEGNEITQAYDVAWSAQGRAGTSGGWQDVIFRNNYVHRCSQSIEFWSTGSKDSRGFERILVEGNVFERAGYSVFSDVRPDQDVRVHLLTYFLETPVDITIQDNTFDGAFGAYSYHVHDPVGLLTRRNTIRLRPGLKMQHQRRETVEQAAAWQKATGREIGSTITALQ